MYEFMQIIFKFKNWILLWSIKFLLNRFSTQNYNFIFFYHCAFSITKATAFIQGVLVATAAPSPFVIHAINVFVGDNTSNRIPEINTLTPIDTLAHTHTHIVQYLCANVINF